MKRSFLSRISGAVVALALGTTTIAAVGAASPAGAAQTCNVAVTLRVGASTVVYGGYESLSADVTPAASCADNYVSDGAGSVRLERSLNGGRSWQAIKVGSYPSYVSYYGSNIIRASGLYRAYYTGGTESTTDATHYNASASRIVRINVIRDIDVKDKSNHRASVGRFKLTPAVGLVGKKLVFQVKKGKKWKKYKKVKVKSGGVFKTSFKNSRKGIKYRLIVPAAAGLSAYTYGPFTATRG
jgi:hypothetical protein